MVLDASVCVSFLNADDELHVESVRWLEREILEGTAFFAPTLLLIEVAGALARRTSRSDIGRGAITHLRESIGIQLVPIDRIRVESFARLAADLQLRGADATYVAVAHEIGVPLVTWDREQLSRASKIITAFTPASPRRNDHVE